MTSLGIWEVRAPPLILSPPEDLAPGRPVRGHPLPTCGSTPKSPQSLADDPEGGEKGGRGKPPFGAQKSEESYKKRLILIGF